MANLEDSEEIDYMSDEFLAQCTRANDIRPGLAGSYSLKRKYEMEKKKVEKDIEHQKKLKPAQLRNNRLQEGMATAIDSSNKGFAMLQKMGYKPGMSLGKAGKGRLEPVGVELKSDRRGLGWQQIILQKRELQKIRREQQKESIDPEEYRARLSNIRQQKLIDKDLSDCRKACYNLDQSAEIKEPFESWFWPVYTLKQDEEENDDPEEDEEAGEALEPSDQLDVLTSYLRERYYYCIWCGHAYESVEGFNEECPGNTRADHD